MPSVLIGIDAPELHCGATARLPCFVRITVDEPSQVFDCDRRLVSDLFVETSEGD